MKDFKYLNQFQEIQMQHLLQGYEAYVKQCNLARRPILFLLIILALSRFLGRENMPVNILIILVLSGLMVWMGLLIFRQLKQRKQVRLLLQDISNQYTYAYVDVRKEFNTLVKQTYRGPRI